MTNALTWLIAKTSFTSDQMSYIITAILAHLTQRVIGFFTITWCP